MLTAADLSVCDESLVLRFMYAKMLAHRNPHTSILALKRFMRGRGRGAVVIALALIAVSWGAAAETPELRLGGSVLVPGGAPLAGATVELRRQPSNHRWATVVLEGASPAAAATAVSDSDGRFSLTVPEAGVWRLRVSAPGRVPMRRQPLPLVTAVELPPVTLHPDAGSTVTVRHATGAPAAGVTVYARGAGGGPWASGTTAGWRPAARLTRSGAEGRLHLPRAAGETLEVFAFPPGVALPRAATGEGAVELRLPPTDGLVPIPLQVRLADRSPAAGLVVATGPLAWPRGRTGEDGRLALHTTPGDQLDLHLFAADGRRWRARVPAPRAATGDRPGGGPVSLTLEPAPPLAGRLVARPGGPALPGALVWPLHDPGNAVLTTGDGSYVLPAPAGDSGRVQAEAAGRLPRLISLRRGEDGWQAPAVALPTAAALSGRVVNGDGEPVAGAHVAARIKGTDERPPAVRPDDAVRAASAEDGRFTLRGLPADARLTAVARRPGFLPAHGDHDLTAAADRPLVLVLRPARAATGRVVDPDDRPLAGVRVTARPATAGGGGDAVETVSGEDGSFTFPHLPAAEVDLHAAAGGFAPVRVRGVEVDGGPAAADLGTLVLAPGAALHGRVSTPAGEPVAGARLWVAEADGRPPEVVLNGIEETPPTGESGADGSFRVPDLAAGRRHHLHAAAPGRLAASLPGLVPPLDESAVLVLPPATRLAGRVVDEAEEPVAGARVELVDAAPAPGRLEPPERRPQTATAHSDGDGRFVLDGLATGPVRVTVSAEGFQTSAPRPLRLPTDAEPLFVLRPGATLEGSVRDDAGEPVTGARVTVVTESPSGRLRGFSDDAGGYRVGGIPPGSWPVVVHHAEYETAGRVVAIEPGVQLHDVVLTPGLAVSGRVVDGDGAPVAGARVALQRRLGRGGRQRYTATSGEDGGFRIPRVLDGVYDVSAEAAGHARTAAAEPVRLAGEPVDGVLLALQPGALLEGRVLGLEFHQLETLRLTVGRQGEERFARVDHRGHFRVPDLAPGIWRVEARTADGARQAEARVQVEPPRATVELEFAEAATLEGVVRFGGEPVAAARLALRGHDTAVERAVTSDHAGRFLVADLQPGAYRLDLTHPGLGLSDSRDVEVVTDRRIEIDLLPARVAGRVVSAVDQRRGVAEARVVLERLLAGEAASMTALHSGPSGRFEVARLSPGRYRLEVLAAGYGPRSSELELTAGESRDLTVELEPTAGLELRVRHRAGGVPELVTVSVRGERGEILRQTRAPLHAGRLPLDSVPPGEWTVLVGAGGTVPRTVNVDVPGDPVEVTLRQGARLAVRVPALITENARATLTLLDPSGRPFVGLGDSGRFHHTFPMDGGESVVTGVPPGVWTASVTARDGRVWQGVAVVEHTGGVEAVLE